MTAPVISAGDLVERLDKAVDRCKAILAHSIHEGLDTDFALMAQYRLSEAAARIQKLEAALKPFAATAELLDDDGQDYRDERKLVPVTMAFLRNARSALGEQPEVKV